jgi:predicted PurR-regulated permease PerM
MNVSRAQIRWASLLLLTLLPLYLCWLMIQPFLEVLAWATVLVILFFPFHKRIVEKTKRPGLSAMLSCLLVIVTILLPLSIVATMVVKELSALSDEVKQTVPQLLDPNSPVTGPLLRRISQVINVDTLRTQEFFEARVRSISGILAGKTLGFIGGLVGIVIDVAFIIFTMFYFFRDGECILNELQNLLPLDDDESDQIFRRTYNVIGASIYGSLIIATIQGTLGGLAFWALGIKSPTIWGVVMVLLSLIPIAGAFVVWVPVAIFLLATGHWTKALLLTLWGACVIGVIDNFLRPVLVGHRTRLHELFIFFSVLGGLQVFGLLGIVLGPVVLAITLVLFDVIKHSAMLRKRVKDA